MEQKKVLEMVDHTLLGVASTWEEIKEILDDGMKYGCASACIPASYVKEASEYVNGKLPICTVINVGALKNRRYQEIEDEIRQVHEACGGKVLKVIIETCLLTEEEKIKMCEIVTNAGAEYIKTSTGFSAGGATFEGGRGNFIFWRRGKVYKPWGRQTWNEQVG